MRRFIPKDELEYLSPPNANKKTPWSLRFLESRGREETAQVRLICFPFAGGSASAFRLWDKELGPNVAMVAVELPGRSGRYNEPPLTDVYEIVQQAALGILPFLDRPFVMFGHSAGSLIAFETIKVLSKPPYNLTPLLFIASGGRAPHFPRLISATSPTHLAETDEEFDRLMVERYQNRTLERVKNEFPELLSVLRNTIRADMAAVETYVLKDNTPLPCPIKAYTGSDDKYVIAPPEYLNEWQLYSAAPTKAGPTLFDGAHFYFEENAKPVTKAILQDIAEFLQV